ncbi:MAG: helix-turn-helix domain-containing protein [Candidatus Coatesbacteria bacterium]|nr:helix-turn-helix domain-containing protein [Candidatus Coatesbacteria bacterium]
METLAERIRRLRGALNLRPAELARLVGVPPQYIDNWENRSHRPSARYLPNLAQALGVSERELLTGRRSTTGHRLRELTLAELLEEAEQAAAALPGYQVQRFPLAGEIAAGTPLEAELLEAESIATHVPRGTPENCFFLRVRGDSMTGDGILSGDLVLIDPNFDPEKLNEHDIYAVLLDETEVTLKRLRRVDDVVWMVASNPRVPPVPLRSDDHDQARVLGSVAKLERYYP